ncbi:autoinducer binding domain-containing protein [Rhodovulum sp. YEN HP10]|uniref:helix-turn-helix transcriptional regulator n=1 Tax=Rhodovulum sp. HP10 TaxID=3387397 RepID=UPI0039E112D7
MRLDRQSLDFAETLRAQTSFDALWRVFNDHLRGHGVSHVIYAQTPAVRSRTISQEMLYRSTFPAGFTHRYAEEGMIDHDPRAIHCATGGEEPIYWDRPGNRIETDPGTREVMQLCSDFGVNFGLTLPLAGASPLNRSGAGLCFAADTSGEAADILAASGDSICATTRLFHALAQTPAIAPGSVPLSLRERECLLWSATGLRNKEIAFRLSISEKTVEHHMASAMTKMHAMNRTHAVARALIFGLIVP